MTDKITTIKITKANRQRLTALAGIMQAQTGKKKFANDAVNLLLDLHSKRYNVDLTTLPASDEEQEVPVLLKKGN